MGSEKREQLHIVMYPWFAFGHSIAYLHLANKLAEKGQRVTFLLPPKSILQLQSSNLHPSLITFIPVTIPHVDPLPPGTETTSEVHISLHTHLATAMDRGRPLVESILAGLSPKPDFIFFDKAHWVPEVAKSLGCKSIFYVIVCAISLTGIASSSYKRPFTIPEWSIKHAPEFGEGFSLAQRIGIAMRSCDAMAIRTIEEMEEESCNLLKTKFKSKPVFFTGPALPEPDTKIEARWDEWLNQFGPKSVIFCCFGSQYVLDKDQLQELALGFEMTKLPFLLVVKPPAGCATLEDALPEGYTERVKDRGLIYSGWVPQTQILAHPSLGCFVTHCGFGSTWEGLVSECQLVMVPQLRDQVMNAEMMSGQLEVSVMVEREDDGKILKEKLLKAVKSVMDEDSEVGKLVKNNHAIWREKLQREGFMSSYVENFIKDLRALCDGKSDVNHGIENGKK